MPMTVVVTSKVRDRFRGFLASCMCELAPGVYTAPRFNAGVRERVWAVLEEWFDDFKDGSILMTWPNSKQRGGQEVRTLGLPRVELVEIDGLFLSKRSTEDDETKPKEPASGG